MKDFHKIMIEFMKNGRIIIKSEYQGNEKHLEEIVKNRINRHCKNGVILKVTNLENGNFFTVDSMKNYYM